MFFIYWQYIKRENILYRLGWGYLMTNMNESDAY